MTPEAKTQESLRRFVDQEDRLRRAIAGRIVGQESAVSQAVTALIVGGHTLVEGVPGTGKTLLCRSLARAVQLDFGRIQFTPDLLPADVIGCDRLVTHSSRESVAPVGAQVEFVPGPIFTQFLLADEINRGTPRTQSALLEAMQEHQVTTSGQSRPLDPLFLVFATRNPIEMEGTYPLPEAELDRFLFEISIDRPQPDAVTEIALKNELGSLGAVEPILEPADLIDLRRTAREIIVSPTVVARVAAAVECTHPDAAESSALVREGIRFGAGVRAVQSLVAAGRVEAIRQGRPHLSTRDVIPYLEAALRHRLVPTLRGLSRTGLVKELVEELTRILQKEG